MGENRGKEGVDVSARQTKSDDHTYHIDSDVWVILE